MRVALSASGAGVRPSRSRRCRTSVSIGLRGHFLFFTGGSSGRFGGMNDQCPCHFAPCSIQRLMRSISSSDSFAWPIAAGGIRTASSLDAMRRNSSLLSGSPGTSD